jgi:hypothetical protein
VVEGSLDFDRTINLNKPLEIFGAVVAAIFIIDVEYPTINLEVPSQNRFDSAHAAINIRLNVESTISWRRQPLLKWNTAC